MMHPVRFGVMLPQVGVDWQRTREVAHAAEEAGFESVWCIDHFLPMPDDRVPIFEAWTEITAIAALTQRVRIGHLVLCVSFRSPALLAKMATTLDHVSNGRVTLGIGAGWHAIEYEQYGYPFPPMGIRLQQLDEACTVLRTLWTEERSTFAGRHFELADAACNPKPVQPRLPILIGGGGEKVLLRLVAKHADVWNNLGMHHGDVVHKREVLAGHCRTIGRDPHSILVSQQCLAAIATDRAAARRHTDAVFGALGFLEGSPDLALCGTPDEIRARVEANRALGISAFIMTLNFPTTPEDVTLFGREVIAAYA